jgi:hypothetical protein
MLGPFSIGNTMNRITVNASKPHQLLCELTNFTVNCTATLPNRPALSLVKQISGRCWDGSAARSNIPCLQPVSSEQILSLLLTAHPKQRVIRAPGNGLGLRIPRLLGSR